MLVIRLQRTGRSGHAQFRVVVQDSRRTPTSGKLVAALGHYNPHTKQTSLDKEKAKFYLDHGAQPSDRVARLLKSEGVKLPAWVKLAADKTRPIRNAEKLRKNRPAEPVVEKSVEPAAPAEPEQSGATDKTPAEKVEEVAVEVAVGETLAEPVESTEKIAEAEEVANEEAAKADETDVTESAETLADAVEAADPAKKPAE